MFSNFLSSLRDTLRDAHLYISLYISRIYYRNRGYRRYVASREYIASKNKEMLYISSFFYVSSVLSLYATLYLYKEQISNNLFLLFNNVQNKKYEVVNSVSTNAYLPIFSLLLFVISGYLSIVYLLSTHDTYNANYYYYFSSEEKDIDNKIIAIRNHCLAMFFIVYNYFALGVFWNDAFFFFARGYLIVPKNLNLLVDILGINKSGNAIDDMVFMDKELNPSSSMSTEILKNIENKVMLSSRKVLIVGMLLMSLIQIFILIRSKQYFVSQNEKLLLFRSICTTYVRTLFLFAFSFQTSFLPSFIQLLKYTDAFFIKEISPAAILPYNLFATFLDYDIVKLVLNKLLLPSISIIFLMWIYKKPFIQLTNSKGMNPMSTFIFFSFCRDTLITVQCIFMHPSLKSQRQTLSRLFNSFYNTDEQQSFSVMPEIPIFILINYLVSYVSTFLYYAVAVLMSDNMISFLYQRGVLARITYMMQRYIYEDDSSGALINSLINFAFILLNKWVFFPSTLFICLIMFFGTLTPKNSMTFHYVKDQKIKSYTDNSVLYLSTITQCMFGIAIYSLKLFLLMIGIKYVYSSLLVIVNYFIGKTFFVSALPIMISSSFIVRHSSYVFMHGENVYVEALNLFIQNIKAINSYNETPAFYFMSLELLAIATLLSRAIYFVNFHVVFILSRCFSFLIQRYMNKVNTNDHNDDETAYLSNEIYEYLRVSIITGIVSALNYLVITFYAITEIHKYKNL